MYGLPLSFSGTARDAKPATILSLLFVLYGVSYVERLNLSIIGAQLKEHLGFTDDHLGYAFSAFLIGYTLCQLPSGYLVDRIGGFRVVIWSLIAWCAITVLIGIYAAHGPAEISLLVSGVVILRFALGVAEAPTFAVVAKMIADWFPASQWGIANGFTTAGSFAGPLLAGPLIAMSNVWFGWEITIYLTALPPLALLLLWLLLAQDAPRKADEKSDPLWQTHRARPAAEKENGAIVTSLSDIRRIVLKRNVLLLSLSYGCGGYVYFLYFFWFYLYLVEERGISLVASGFWSVAPTLLAAICAFSGGVVVDALGRRFPRILSRSILGVVVCTFCGTALIFSHGTESAYLAILGFSLAIGVLALLEPSYISTAVLIGEDKAGTASSFMNACSLLGGVISTAMAPTLVRLFGWGGAFAAAAAVTYAQGLLWLLLREGDGHHATLNEDALT